MPTKEKERIECINPKYIEDGDELEKLNNLVAELEETISSRYRLIKVE